MKTIQLTQGMIAIVDDEDYDRLSQHKWQAGRNGRSWTARKLQGRREGEGNRQAIWMSRDIMKAPKGLQVDHIHHDDGVIDNRKENLRLATQQQNSQNRRQRVSSKTKLKGVRRSNRSVRWKAVIEIKGKKVPLGLFEDEIDAACAYDAAARILYGEFAHTNFPYIFVV